MIDSILKGLGGLLGVFILLYFYLRKKEKEAFKDN